MTADNSHYQVLKEQLESAYADEKNLVIQGGGTKKFYGHNCPGDLLELSSCSGIISYEPTELVITARAGTPLSEIEAVLLEQNQILAFEPPHFGTTATLGGMVACGLSGPRRPSVGAVRDYVLGIKCLTGKGEILTFGGQVMKNVAGYDVSRLMTGALGTLGVLLEISIKVLPKPEFEMSLSKTVDVVTAIEQMNTWAGQSLSLSAACYEQNKLNIRLSGKETAVELARQKLTMDVHLEGLEYWQQLREQKLDFFQLNDSALWRISVPSATPPLDLQGEWLLDWGGAQRWFKTNTSAEQVRALVAGVGGHATLFRGGDPGCGIFHPLPSALHFMHEKLKSVFDPKAILNKGRMYPTI